MNKLSAVGLVCMAGLSAVGQANAQSAAPATAQAWEVQLVTTPILPAGLAQSNGPRWIDAVLVTLQARVAIRTPTQGGPTWNTRNLGVSRVGGPTGNFFISLSDGYTRATGQSIVQRDVVPGGLNSSGVATSTDTNGNPLTGTHWAFRQGFGPAGSGGSNTDTQNGIISNTLVNVINSDGTNGNQNLSTITNLVQTRTIGWDGVAQGAATITGFDAFGRPILSGAFADIYSFIYIPKPAENDTFSTLTPAQQASNLATSQTNRDIDVTIDGTTLRYLFNQVSAPSAVGVPNGTAQGSTNVNFPTIRTSFRVPTPGAMAVFGLAGLAAARRRRA